jgi:hypothetical protein
MSNVAPRQFSSAAFTARTTPIAPELGRAFAAMATRDTPERSTRLYDLTVTFVRRLQSDGLPPERVIVALKAAIAKYGDGHRPPSLTDEWVSAEDHNRASAYQRVFHWCLEAYFDKR